MNAVITFLVGTRVVCTCGYKSPVRYVDDALEKQVRHAYEMGHAFSRATEENVSHGTAHYKEIGEERWKAEGHQSVSYTHLTLPTSDLV